MSKIYFLAAAVLTAAVALSSCEKIDIDDDYMGEETLLCFTASIANDIETRTEIHSDGGVSWKDGDKISINGLEYEATALQKDSSKAVFTAVGDVVRGDTFNAFYPSTIQTGVTAGGTFPATLTYDAGAKYLPMFATGETTYLSFYNITSAVKVSLSQSVTVKSIQVLTDKAVNGAFTVDESNTALMTKTADLTDADKCITLDCGADGIPGADFYLPVPVATYTSLKVIVTKADGKTMEMTAIAPEIKMDRSTIYSFNFRRDGTFTINGDIWAEDVW